jgi:predicted nucleotidyltransferase
MIDRTNRRGQKTRPQYNARVVTQADIFARGDQIVALGRRYGASQFRLFGSVARGDAGPSSDIDFIVRFEPQRSLFDHGGLVMDLRELLGARVDVIDEDAMRPRFRAHVVKDTVPL